MLGFSRKDAIVYIPDNTEEKQALARTTHMAISAHQDDIEIMAISGVLDCYGRKDRWFSACVVTDGAGSPRDGLYADFTDEEMMEVRREEQKRAAHLGDYGSCVLLNHPSKVVKNAAARETVEDIKALLLAARPKVVITHNLADKHDTHVAVALRVIAAIRELPREARPEKLYSGEVWRSLDWVNDDEKTVFNVSEHPGLSNALLGVFDSQVAGGKRYDLASAGRRIANATYYASHAVDKMDAATYALDISPLMDGGDPAEFIAGYISRFAADVAKRVKGVQ